jgi:plastocyanin
MLAMASAHAQDAGSSAAIADVQIRLALPGHSRQPIPPAVLWLKPLDSTSAPAFPPHARYTLLQKNRMFTPHLLVVPVGTEVQFPNADPFFHNVFSLFDGKRFDLGLYEAGSSKAVTFSREGVSYIFCNIHPEMSAVVLALSTPIYTVSDSKGVFHFHNVAPGEYDLHLWVEGVPATTLDKMTRRVHVAADSRDLGEVAVPGTLQRDGSHSNKFGQPYDKSEKPSY